MIVHCQYCGVMIVVPYHDDESDVCRSPMCQILDGAYHTALCDPASVCAARMAKASPGAVTPEERLIAAAHAMAGDLDSSDLDFRLGQLEAQWALWEKWGTFVPDEDRGPSPLIAGSRYGCFLDVLEAIRGAVADAAMANHPALSALRDALAAYDACRDAALSE